MLFNCIASGQYLFQFTCAPIWLFIIFISILKDYWMILCILKDFMLHPVHTDSSVSDKGVKVHSYPQCQSYLTFPRVHSRSKLAFISKYVQLFDIFVREKHLFSPKEWLGGIPTSTSSLQSWHFLQSAVLQLCFLNAVGIDCHWHCCCGLAFNEKIHHFCLSPGSIHLLNL